MSRLGPALLALLLAAGLGRPAALLAQEEEILSYDVVIDVRPGGSMLVTEAIRVRALGNEIRRGIYRDFPTSFPRSSGIGRIEAPFTVRSVKRDGVDERYSLEAIGGEFARGGMRVRIGRSDVFLDPGEYTYEITYETDRWVHFGEGEDQLYWNVTGNGWGFGIRSASATVRIPELRAAPRLESWTGYQGATSTTATATWDASTSSAHFVNDRPLAPSEGLTISLTFPSGQLTPPTEAQQDAWFRLDWGGYVDAGYVVLFVIAVYLLMWRRVGMDPAASPTGLRTEPPEGYSPAALGFIEQRGYDSTLLSSALVSLALKGAVRIDERDGSWTVHRLDKDPRGLSPEEKELFDGLLGSRQMIEFEQSKHATLSSAIKRFKKSLERRLEREYFVTNRKWFAAGLVISLVGLFALGWRWRFDMNPVSLFLMVWLTGWTAGVATLVWRLWVQLRLARNGGGAAAWGGVVFMGLFSIPFVGAEIVVLTILLVMTPSHFVLAAIAVGAVNVLFYHLLERPTLKGRGVLDELDGFRRYLDADDERALHGGDRLARFEQFLPFAIALGLERAWSQAFADVLTPAVAGGEALPVSDGRTRPMSWYTHDHGRGFSSGGFASSLGSGLSSSFSAASSPPQSSSGGGGGFSSGGSSGGGGGGGGGGGW